MRLAIAGVFALLLVAGGVVLGTAFTIRGAAQAPLDLQCGPASALQLRTTLYFGLGRPKGQVSELEWQIFLRDNVTPSFPEGLTVWEAAGQWRRPDAVIDHERVKVLLLVHTDTPAARSAVQSVIATYRQKFDQESVLWETTRVCVAA